MLQSREQRQAIVETAMACTPRDRTVIVHVGAASLHEALALSSHAAKAGAHAITSLPPPSAQFSFADLRRYYEALAAASDLPLLVYYFPDVAPAIATAEQLETLCALPNVIGVKFTDFDLFRMAQPDAARPRRLQRPRRGAGGRPADGRRRRHRHVLQPAAGAVRGDLRGGDRRSVGRRAGRPASRQHRDPDHAAVPAVSRRQADAGVVGPGLRGVPAAARPTAAVAARAQARDSAARTTAL